jgi:hypothetical protein
MFQRVRIAGRVLPGNLRKIHPQDLSSFLYASKRCSSRFDHRLCLLVLEQPCSPSLEHSSSSLLDPESLSLKLPSSLLIDGLLLRDARAPASTALPSLGRVRVASTWSRPASAVVDRVAPPYEGRDAICRLKPLKRYECCSMGLMVKSSIFPTWPVFAMSRASWARETPRPPQPSRIVAVKEWQCAECGRNVISVSVGEIALGNGLRLESPSDILVSMLCGIEGAGGGNRPLALELVATLEHWSRGECDLRYWRWGGRRWWEELS